MDHRTISLILIIGTSIIAQGGDSSPLFHGPIGSRHSEYPAESSRGYLTVYLRADEFYGNTWYFPHNLFDIYTIDGELFPLTEIPEVVRLPVGFYLEVARSEKNGYIRLPVAIKAGHRTILDLDLRQEGA